MDNQKPRKMVSRPVVIGIIILLAWSLPIVLWFSQAGHPLNVWVLDKTVPHQDYREHSGLFWVLDYAKVLNPITGKVYNYGTDYYGFHPEANNGYTVDGFPAGVQNPALIYVTDTYGVYRDDYDQENLRGDRSPKIYGGLDEKDLYAIKSNLNNTTLIAEFNSLASPTDLATRKGIEEVLGIRWDKWMGRYFDELKPGGEVPKWMMNNYKIQYGKEWLFTGPGVVFTSDEDRIMVLVWKDDFGPEGITFSLKAPYDQEFGVTRVIPYYYWFEYTSPREGTEVLASYKMDLTDSGKQKLQALGLPAEFPAILRSKKPAYTAYYFAGDFADNVEAPYYYQYQGYPIFKKTASIDLQGDQQAFYWRAYVPIMLKIVGDIEASPRK